MLLKYKTLYSKIIKYRTFYCISIKNFRSMKDLFIAQITGKSSLRGLGGREPRIKDAFLGVEEKQRYSGRKE